MVEGHQILLDPTEGETNYQYYWWDYNLIKLYRRYLSNTTMNLSIMG